MQEGAAEGFAEAEATRDEEVEDHFVMLVVDMLATRALVASVLCKRY